MKIQIALPVVPQKFLDELRVHCSESISEVDTNDLNNGRFQCFNFGFREERRIWDTLRCTSDFWDTL